MNIIYLTAYFL